MANVGGFCWALHSRVVATTAPPLHQRHRHRHRQWRWRWRSATRWKTCGCTHSNLSTARSRRGGQAAGASVTASPPSGPMLKPLDQGRGNGLPQTHRCVVEASLHRCTHPIATTLHHSACNACNACNDCNDCNDATTPMPVCARTWLCTRTVVGPGFVLVGVGRCSSKVSTAKGS
jgi:hypothetical protein